MLFSLTRILHSIVLKVTTEAMDLFVALSVICKLVVIIELAILLFTIYERRRRDRIFAGRPNQRVPTGINDHLTANHHCLNARDLSTADDGNDLKFSIAAKIYGLYESLVYNYPMNCRWISDNRSVQTLLRLGFGPCAT